VYITATTTHQRTTRSILSLLPFYTSQPHLPLHARRDQLALRLGIVVPAAGLLGKLLHASLELRAEVADQALDGPGESLAKGWTGLVST